jgi:putative Mn2+ efflux pump MntP
MSLSWPSLLAIAVALAMDAFAVAIVTGLSLNPMTGRHIFRLAFHFGLFQALMPVAGWYAGSAVRVYIENIDHWLAFGLLAFVGARMIGGALHPDGERERSVDPTRGWDLVLLSVATSIDALAVGLSLAMLGITIFMPALVIGLMAAILTMSGMVLGRSIGVAWGKRVEVAGGLVLFVIGIKILWEHLA